MGTLTVRLNIPEDVDYDDTRSQVRVAVLVRMGYVWVLAPVSGVWFGGFVAGHPSPPFEVPIVGPMSAPDALGNTLPLYDMRGTFVRVEIEVIRAIKLGVSVTSRVPK